MQFWSGDRLAIEISGPQGASEVVVPHPYALIGALGKADVRLVDDGMQKRAALLYAIDSRIMCRRLEGEIPEPYCEIPQNEPLQLGPYRLRARIIPQEDGAVSFGEEKPRIPVLRVRHKARASVNRRLYRELETVGRAIDCDLELRSSQVSLYHCVLLREGSRLWCIDLGSGNGTALNGQPVQCAPFELGNRLRIGDFELEFQRYSRRSAASPGVIDSPAGSHLSLSPSPLLEDRRFQPNRYSDEDPQGESIFGSKVTETAAPHGSGSALSGLATLTAPATDEVLRLEARQAELDAQQSDLQRRLEALADENARLQNEQVALAQQLAPAMEAQRAALLDELQQQTQSDKQQLVNNLTERLDDGLRSTVDQLARVESQQQTLSQLLSAQLAELGQSRVSELAAQVETLKQGLWQESARKNEELSTLQENRLSEALGALRSSLIQELNETRATLARAQSEQLAIQGKAQLDQLASQASDLRRTLSEELQQRLEELAATQAQQLQLQADAHRLSMLQELSRRLDSALEARTVRPAAANEPAQPVDSQQWLQRLEELRSAQSEETSLAIATQEHGLSAQMTQRLGDLRQSIERNLAVELQEQRQAVAQEMASRFETQVTELREQLSSSTTQRIAEVQSALAQSLSEQLQQQHLALSRDLVQRIECQSAAVSQQLIDSTSRQQEADQVQARQLAAQVDQLRESLFQQLTERADVQQAAFLQQLQATLAQQQAAETSGQQQRLAAVAEQLQPLASAVERIVQEQIQLSRRMDAHAAQQVETDDLPIDWQPRPNVDEFGESSVSSLDTDIHERTELLPSYEPSEAETAMSGALAEEPRGIGRQAPGPIDADDPLLHFVSDRLADMDSGRQRWMAIYWIAAIAAVLVLGVAGWALWYWLLGQSPT